LWIFATIDIRLLYCSQGAPQIFAAPVYRAHCAVIFATAQLSCYTFTIAPSPALLFPID